MHSQVAPGGMLGRHIGRKIGPYGTPRYSTPPYATPPHPTPREPEDGERQPGGKGGRFKGDGGHSHTPLFISEDCGRLHGGPDAVSHGQSRLVAASRGFLRKKRLFIFCEHLEPVASWRLCAFA